MKARIIRLTAVLTLGVIIMATPVMSAQAQTVSSGVTSSIQNTITEETTVPTEEVQASDHVASGVSNVLSEVINTSTQKASVEAQEAVKTAAAPVAGYTNLGIAQVSDSLNVRQSPDETSELVGKMQNDAAAEIVENVGEWSHIKSGEVEGYVKTQYLITGADAKEYAKTIVSTIATVQTTTLYVRQEPNTECEVIAMMPDGEKLEVIENLGDWIRVSVDSEEGYVSAEYVSLAEELPKAMTMTEVKYGSGVSDIRVDLINFAVQFVGNRYVWGGTSLTNGADCSGFVQSVFKNYGIYLPRTSGSQASAGTKVSTSEALPGDLFFYGSGSGINHVAIYIGNGQVVHASNARTGIKISNAYYRTPVRVQRILE
ncbi:MAG: NlpC/P60 family protein [Lachnospiraceae bacterium]